MAIIGMGIIWQTRLLRVKEMITPVTAKRVDAFINAYRFSFGFRGYSVKGKDRNSGSSDPFVQLAGRNE
jgi:hypothetical protein